MHNIPVITIDGCSGSGKGCVGRMVANSLNWHFLDSGQLYRALALLVRKLGIAADDLERIRSIAHDFNLVTLRNDSGNEQVFLNNDDVTAPKVLF